MSALVSRQSLARSIFNKCFIQQGRRQPPAEIALKTSIPANARRTFLHTRPRPNASSNPVGIEAAVRAASDPSFKPQSSIFKNEFSLAGRVAIVTGGHRGIGLDAAEALAEAGATVYCLDLSEKPDDTWRATQSYIDRISTAEEGVGRLEYVKSDVTDQKGLWAIVEDIAAKEGRLDACVASAGTLGASSCLDYPAEDFEHMFRINVNGAMYTAQAAARQMVAREIAGSIVLVASLSSVNAIRGADASAYASSKAAVVQLARSLACELGPRGIRVNSLSPGYLYSQMTQPYGSMYEVWAQQNPLGRCGKTHEMRGVVTWLASDASSFCTGSDIAVSGGHHSW